MQLGGIGARSRRTAGSIFVSSTDLDYFPEALQIGTKKELANQLGEIISDMRKSLHTNLPNPHINSPSKFDVLHPDVCKIWVLGVAESSELLVKIIGEKMQAYRTNAPVGQNKDTWLLERSVFGMPVKGLKGLERRSSPLWLKISKVDKYYVGLATLFKSQLLPTGEKIGYPDTGGMRRFKAPHADYGIIETWIQKNFKDVAEVTYV